MKRTKSGLFGLVTLGVFAALAWAERRRALRSAVEKKGERVSRNLAVGALTGVTVSLAERPVVVPLARRVEARRLGLAFWLQKQLGFPDWLRDAVAVVLMDYTLYWWHVVLHRVPVLYRAHVVHHADLDLDASTGLRFHFAEFMLSVPWRAAQIAVIGVSPRALVAWQRLTLLSVLFHHSNVRLPLGVERRLSLLVMTPRLHGIHHSIVTEEQSSNWSSGLTVWDRLHGTYRDDVPQQAIDVGVAAFRDPAYVTLPRLIAMPFVEQPPLDRLPNGERARQATDVRGRREDRASAMPRP